MKKTIALAVLAAFMASPAFAEGDVASGEKVFKKCAACHAVGEGAKAKVGPVLNGLIGRTAGTNEEYASKYSKDMVEAGAGGLVWNDETLNTYLENPKGMIKKTKMAFAGLKKEEDRADVIAYLKTFTPAE
ncbi:MAG: cytochrome c family protein [Nitratireductor sp.]|nr:cytochrome c family protein [Nitratireductor sp.]